MATDPSPLQFTSEITALVNGGIDSGNVLLLAAVDPQGKPILSFRGSTAVFSETELSLWVRNVEGGTVGAISKNPNVALMYRSPTVPMLQFIGRAHIVTNQDERNKAFELSHAREQAQDPERKGIAILIAIDKINGVLGFGADGPIWCNMERK